ncbi:cellulase family glycosylhydrolase [Paenibacillus tarimensis]
MICKKGRKVFISLITALIAVALMLPGVSIAAASEGKGAGKPKSEIEKYAAAMQPGWNLGNTLDAVGDETSWGNPKVTKELIEAIKAQGFKSIRIPITWDHRMGSGPEYLIAPEFMDRVQEIVDWSLEAGLYVMINLHHDSWLWVHEMQTNPGEVPARFNAAWTQIAEHFKDYPKKLMFESINEPFFQGGAKSEAEVLDEVNTSFFQIVRASGGNNATRPLVLPTVHTNAGQERLNDIANTIEKLNDPYLIATVHYYGFWPFSVNIAGFTRFDQTTQNDIIESFDRTFDTLSSKGIPVVVGEFGLLGFDVNTNVLQQGEKLKFFEFVIHYFNEKQATHMLWDNGQHFNRHTLQWNDPELFNIMKAAWNGRSSTAQADFIYLEKGAPINDEVLPLNLHGNELKKIIVDGKKLNEGTDYVLSGEELTIKANKLTALTSSGQIGKNAELILDFNKGADWRVDLITYETPKLESVTGTTESFAIPTAFGGDRVATMEATYTSGGNAGPHGWTSFKEFGRAFTPNYDANEIQLHSSFFNEVEDDREVTLKFHFWSGEMVTYTLTKSGASVVGTANDTEA